MKRGGAWLLRDNWGERRPTQDEHGGKGGRFTWWTDCRAHGSGKKPKGSRWGCCRDLLPVDRLYSAETCPLPFSPASGVFSPHLGGTRKNQACQVQGSVQQFIMTAIKTVNSTQNQRGKRRAFLWQEWGEETDPTSFYHPKRSPLVSTLGAQPAETWCPNPGSWDPRARVWGSCGSHMGQDPVPGDHISALYLQCVLSPLRLPTSELQVLPD